MQIDPKLPTQILVVETERMRRGECDYRVIYAERLLTASRCSWNPYTDSSLLGHTSTSYKAHNATSDPVHFAKSLSSPSRDTDPRLDFARGRTILMIGESIDRDNTQSFCSQSGSYETLMDEVHMLFACRLPVSLTNEARVASP